MSEIKNSQAKDINRLPVDKVESLRSIPRDGFLDTQLGVVRGVTAIRVNLAYESTRKYPITVENDQQRLAFENLVVSFENALDRSLKPLPIKLVPLLMSQETSVAQQAQVVVEQEQSGLKRFTSIIRLGRSRKSTSVA